ncbi:AMP-binding protein [Corynebacterium sp. YIM 101645]|uniref:AMP-binding protein n=1 Tax=Corynebacterium lemuris TaxID=1859292 RepID=A0ABT2FSC0_9CORY|nr:AMP-binding protein [Corynebacterium lemuris]MCS5478123.1 AMP-binding protein [Corynebacterium lemuris]
MRTIGDWLHLHQRQRPAKEALVGVDGRRTYGELAERSWALGRGLRSLGAQPGSHIGVLAANTVYNAEMFFSIAATGGVYVAYNWRWTELELAEGIEETGAGIILVEEQFLGLLEGALEIYGRTHDELPTVIVQGTQTDNLRQGSGPLTDQATLDSPLCIIYTGGSTGKSKGVVLSHRAAVSNAFNELVDCQLGSRPHERGLIVTPLFHSAGLLCWLVSHFVGGATSVLAPKFDAESLVDWVGREKITNTFMIPNMMRKMMDNGVLADPVFRQNLRALHTGAGLLRMPDKELFADMLPGTDLYYRYGLTEAGPMVTRLRPEDMFDPEVDGSIGQEYFMAEVQLQDPDGRPTPVGELGEICVRGPSLMSGYYGRPEQTAEALQNGWLRTGDVATKNDRGYYFFRDRLKEMIKTGGENVYAAEVEQALHMHPAVLEAAVVGVPDLKWDEEVRAAIVLRSEIAATQEELSTFLRTQLAGYKIPKQMVFLQPEELPRSAAGKLRKATLKQNLGWASPDPAARTTKTETF